MAERSTAATQMTAARIAGFTLLLLMASGIAGMFASGRHLVMDGDAVATARNILAHEEGISRRARLPDRRLWLAFKGVRLPAAKQESSSRVLA